jgi:prepilin-type N-terminal cleavage/methylation domain-containing protein
LTRDELKREFTRGFTLAEVLVALAILGVLLVAAFQVSSTGLEIVGRSEAQRISLLHARSLIEELGSVVGLRAGEFSGEFPDGARWQGNVRLYESPWNAALAETPLQLYEVSVTVTSARGDAVSLKTLRMTR